MGGSWRWMAEEEVSRDIFGEFLVVNTACIDYGGRFWQNNELAKRS